MDRMGAAFVMLGTASLFSLFAVFSIYILIVHGHRRDRERDDGADAATI
jgi:hypothetical protein